MKRTLATLALLLAALLTATPAHARPLHGNGHFRDTGSCAKVLAGSLGACDFPNLHKRHPFTRCYHPGFRERHPNRCERVLERLERRGHEVGGRGRMGA